PVIGARGASVAQAFPVVFALYPGVTPLDFAGPLEVFLRLPGARVVLAASAGGELALPGLTVSGVVPLAEVQECVLLCVPAGSGPAEAMRYAAYLAPLRRLAGLSRYVTSVCTGSLLLGAAGLLRAVAPPVTGPSASCSRTSARRPRRRASCAMAT